MDAQGQQQHIEVGDTITFELKATKKYHCHEVIRKEQGTYIVECDGKELTVTPEEIREVFTR